MQLILIPHGPFSNSITHTSKPPVVRKFLKSMVGMSRISSEMKFAGDIDALAAAIAARSLTILSSWRDASASSACVTCTDGVLGVAGVTYICM